MNKKTGGASLFIVLLALAYAMFGQGDNLDPSVKETPPSQNQVQSTASKDYSFRSEELFDSHYEKHGSEFGNITKEEYLAGANSLINSSSENVLTKTERDGDTLYYNSDTNEFGVLSSDGYIRTYFKPDDGIDYFNRQ